MTKEQKFQADLCEEIEDLFPGCIILETDPHSRQGIPDLVILYKDKWFSLECKRSRTASHRPNQDYYVRKMDYMSFSRFIFPENKGEVLNEIQRTFKS
ncbi:MAG: hypothetical protein HUJ68_07925 [Clostridia bacterium]|nr:hypothetical protein [Clostridia bacterium]